MVSGVCGKHDMWRNRRDRLEGGSAWHIASRFTGVYDFNVQRFNHGVSPELNQWPSLMIALQRQCVNDMASKYIQPFQAAVQSRQGRLAVSEGLYIQFGCIEFITRQTYVRRIARAVPSLEPFLLTRNEIGLRRSISTIPATVSHANPSRLGALHATSPPGNTQRDRHPLTTPPSQRYVANINWIHADGRIINHFRTFMSSCPPPTAY